MNKVGKIVKIHKTIAMQKRTQRQTESEEVFEMEKQQNQMIKKKKKITNDERRRHTYMLINFKSCPDVDSL